MQENLRGASDNERANPCATAAGVQMLESAKAASEGEGDVWLRGRPRKEKKKAAAGDGWEMKLIKSQTSNPQLQ